MDAELLPSNVVPLLPTSSVKRFVPPSQWECRAQAKEIGLTEHEADKFFHFYESKGWMVGKARMVVWRGAMAGWKLRWQERQLEKQQRVAEPSKSVQIIQWQNELKRVEEAVRQVRGAHWFDGHWDTETSRKEFLRLVGRKAELIKSLGMAI